MESTDLDVGNLVMTAWMQLWHQVEAVLHYPLQPGQRIHLLYLLTATGFALIVFVRAQASPDFTLALFARRFFRFLFPAAIWKEPSAWLDVRYFFFHQIIFVSLFGWLGLAVTNWALQNSATALLAQTGGAPLWLIQNRFIAGIIYMLALMVAIDLTAFGIHYLQHKVPFLWAFHKVHHSAKVLHPFTNYREHPVDNIFYIVGTSLVTGVIAGLSVFLIGGVVPPPAIMGISLLAFLFNFLGYNLRHSHIWLRWPGPLNFLFGCPAHHQVHHSYHPDHIDRNFAFMFPVWDLMIGTYCLPETNKDVKIGLGTGEEDEFRTCLGLYLVPFRKLWVKNSPEQLKSP